MNGPSYSISGTVTDAGASICNDNVTHLLSPAFGQNPPPGLEDYDIRLYPTNAAAREALEAASGSGQVVRVTGEVRINDQMPECSRLDVEIVVPV